MKRVTGMEPVRAFLSNNDTVMPGIPVMWMVVSQLLNSSTHIGGCRMKFDGVMLDVTRADGATKL